MGDSKKKTEKPNRAGDNNHFTGDSQLNSLLDFWTSLKTRKERVIFLICLDKNDHGGGEL